MAASFAKAFKYYYLLLCAAMETLSVRFDNDFLQDMEKAMKSHRYMTKAEFIREAIREKIIDLEKAYGASKRKTTQEQLEKAKVKAFEDVESKFK